MLKAVILCIVVRASEISVYDLPRTNVGAERNSSSIVNSTFASVAIGSAEFLNSSSSKVVDDIVDEKRSSANNKTSANEVFSRKQTVVNKITDNPSPLSISDLTPSGDDAESVLDIAINGTV